MSDTDTDPRVPTERPRIYLLDLRDRRAERQLRSLRGDAFTAERLSLGARFFIVSVRGLEIDHEEITETDYFTSARPDYTEEADVDVIVIGPRTPTAPAPQRAAGQLPSTVRGRPWWRRLLGRA